MFRSTFFFSSFDSTVFAFFFFFNDTATTEIYTLSLHDALPISLFEQVGYDDAFTFKYSPREGTPATRLKDAVPDDRSEEHTSELQSRLHLVCRLLLEKKKKNRANTYKQTTDIDSSTRRSKTSVV